MSLAETLDYVISEEECFLFLFLFPSRQCTGLGSEGKLCLLGSSLIRSCCSSLFSVYMVQGSTRDLGSV